jgi:hypothetical protein
MGAYKVRDKRCYPALDEEARVKTRIHLPRVGDPIATGTIGGKM